MAGIEKAGTAGGGSGEDFGGDTEEGGGELRDCGMRKLEAKRGLRC